MRIPMMLMLMFVATVEVVEAGSLRRWAKTEARLMHKRNSSGHQRGVPAGARFVGVGTNGTTCMTHGRPAVVVHYRGKSVRVWR